MYELTTKCRPELHFAKNMKRVPMGFPGVFEGSQAQNEVPSPKCS